MMLNSFIFYGKVSREPLSKTPVSLARQVCRRCDAVFDDFVLGRGGITTRHCPEGSNGLNRAQVTRHPR